MKIEAAIVARPRFRRVLGKLNCTAENCPGRVARGVGQRGIPYRKQVAGTNFQFNRSSEWPTDSLCLFLHPADCDVIAHAELANCLHFVKYYFCDAEDYVTAWASRWSKSMARLFAWFHFGLNVNFVLIITRNISKISSHTLGTPICVRVPPFVLAFPFLLSLRLRSILVILCRTEYWIWKFVAFRIAKKITIMRER